ncbi:MAG: hypothetical protein KBG28_17585 [Kofleriaceae bacterium]|jgi:hypothetical protein|nr:hypothetical protein [Kofleriaceae bacterium]MBP6837762.1 hypothetical protein [Kofleriaceae bacterium]MBP9205790.1 hypothetical protein [Kofleriaceae bacterium]
MLPAGHLGVVACGTRRAQAWKDALAVEGITAVLIDNDSDAAGGEAMIVAVPRLQVPAANALISAVTRGERDLAGRRGWLGAVVVVLVAALIIGWFVLAG